jgi:hypothetical protein
MRAGVRGRSRTRSLCFQTEAASLDWEFIVVESNRPAVSIRREAEQKTIDLIVMSAHRQPHAAVLLGSTAAAVCRSAPCPVLVTRARRADHPTAACRSYRCLRKFDADYCSPKMPMNKEKNLRGI